MNDRALKFLKSIGIKHPVIQAPMAGVDTPELAIAVSKAGGLGSLACALLSPDAIQQACTEIRKETAQPFNLNFFCHRQNTASADQQSRWKQRLAPYYKEFGIDVDAAPPSAKRAPFDDQFCQIVEDVKPHVVSFHFGLPEPSLLSRVKATGAMILSSATTLAEALWLEKNGCDAIIAQGAEAGGHRAIFLSTDIDDQPDTETLVTEIAKHTKLPVIAAGGIADRQDVEHMLSLGASAVQIGTAYLFCPEARISPLYKKAISENTQTTLTNVFSGRPARGIVNRFIQEMGEMSQDAPEFPYASRLVNPLRQASEKAGSTDFMQMWAGTHRIPHDMDAKTLTLALAPEI